MYMPRVPLRYVPKQLTLRDKRKAKKELNLSRKLYKKGVYYTRKNIPSFKLKKLHHIIKAQQMYNVNKIGVTTELSKATGCSKKNFIKDY